MKKLIEILINLNSSFDLNFDQKEREDETGIFKNPMKYSKLKIFKDPIKFLHHEFEVSTITLKKKICYVK